MKNQSAKAESKLILALGMFDGVHAGHHALLSRAVELAEQQCARVIALTFANHPQTLFGKELPLLTNAVQRAALLQREGVEADMLPFTEEMAKISPVEFVDFLQAHFSESISTVVVGESYRFGHEASGTPELLQSLGQNAGFETVILPTLCVDGAPVSSSRIRLLLTNAELSEASRLLGRPYAVCGLVMREKGLATRLGFPTANLTATGIIPLPNGVYVSRVEWEGETYPAVTNIGKRPTVGGKERAVETHIIGATPNLDDQWLCVEQLAYLRPEKNFASLSELREQVKEDIKTSLDMFSKAVVRGK